ncbi:hypothetical protein BGX23_003106 [Mortierella sp. AD031]|nr:hypothetical protein BGX23_003106 [Mortierella sp. AD031]
MKFLSEQLLSRHWLGILDDFVSIGKYGTYNTTYKESMEPNRPTDYLPIEGFTGYKQYLVARPKLYDLLLSQVPPHKVHFGAVTAIHDAVALANLLYALPTTTASEITKVFEEYKAERHPAAVDSYKNSQIMSKIVDKGIVGAIMLFWVNRMPTWLWRLALAKTVKHRPLVGFLQPLPVKGTVIPIVSPSTEKARAVYKKQEAAASV